MRNTNIFKHTDKKVGKYTKRTWRHGGVDWLYKGRFHKEDGPAVFLPSGARFWWLDGQQLSEEGWRLEMRKLKLKALGL